METALWSQGRSQEGSGIDDDAAADVDDEDDDVDDNCEVDYVDDDNHDHSPKYPQNCQHLQYVKRSQDPIKILKFRSVRAIASILLFHPKPIWLLTAASKYQS